MIALAGGDDRTYQVDCRSTNFLCRLEELDGRPHHEVIAEVKSRRPRSITLHRVVMAMVVEPKVLTLNQAREVLVDVGGVDLIRAAMGSRSVRDRIKRKWRTTARA